jgi:hypothetical protein
MKILVLILVITLVIIFLTFIYRILKIKEVYCGEFKDGLIEFYLRKDQKYLISFFEGYFEIDNGVSFILHEKLSKEKVILNKYLLKYQFFHKGLKGFDYLYFDIVKSDVYLLEIKNAHLLELASTNLWIKKALYSNKKQLQRKILIREGMNQREFVFFGTLIITILIVLIIIISNLN